MIGRLNHVAIVVPDLAAAAAIYRDTLGARVSEPHRLLEHGVAVVFVELPNTKIEFLEPLGTGAPRRPRLLLKAGITTAVAAVIWLGIYVLVREPWFSFRGS